MRRREPPDPSSLNVSKVLLASEGRPISEEAVDFAASFRAPVYVFSIARVFGTSLGFPNPGLLPMKHEWDEQRGLVDKAVKALGRRGIDSGGRVIGTRRGAKRIVDEAERRSCDVIVMAADAPKPWLLADFMWSQEPYRVRRRAKVPVYLVTGD